MNIGVVILNYNSFSLTKELANKLSGFESVNHICVVDNNSEDDFDGVFLSPKIHYFKNRKNTGYAAGNNIGLRYLVNEVGCDYVFISNPDVYFEETAIEEMCRYMDEYPSIGLISTKRFGHNNSQIHQYHIFPSFKTALLNNFSLLNKLSRTDSIDEQNKKVDIAKPYLKVDAVPGAFFGIRSELLKKIDFLYEGTFLYREEIILGRQALEKGYHAAVISSATHVHDHFIARFSNKRMFKQDRVSLMIYYDKFQLLSPLKKLLLKIGIFIGCFEYNIAYTMFNLLRKSR